MLPNTAVLIFAKAPIPGTAKTRLIPKYGSQKAAELHAAMLKQIVDTVAQWGKCDIQLWCTPDSGHDLFKELTQKYPLSLHTQEGDDLGQRMYNAFFCVLKKYDSAIIVGTDCPTLNASLLEQAHNKLNEDLDAVIAPATDGGYVLLGLKKLHVKLFSSINWGTETVFDQTMRRLELLDLRWYKLDDQWDVDRPGDVIRLKRLASNKELHPDLQKILNSV